MWAHWRGRYGLSEADQAQVWASVDASREDTAMDTRQSEKGGEEVGLRFRTFDGELKEVRGTMGESLLEVGKREGLPALEGVCGGNLGECMAPHIS
jgi:ferredoxin